MSDDQVPRGFPDVSSKLAAPIKQSLFQRQKAEADAKRAREEAENAAALETFVASFGGDEPPPADNSLGSGNSTRDSGMSQAGSRGASGPPKRHFPPNASRGLKSGPGTLDPGSSTVSRKRAYDGSSKQHEREGEHGIFGFNDGDSPKAFGSAQDVFRHSEDVEEDIRGADAKAAERAAPNPTLQLSSVPPGTSPAVIKSLLPASLTVEGVRVLSPGGNDSTKSTERKSVTVIVTLARDTPASEIDNAVNSLQHRYLGWGFYLNIARHLSSAALESRVSSGPGMHSSLASLPFGAKAIPVGSGPSLSRAPPPEAGRGFAPPSDYTPSNFRQLGRAKQAPAQVNIKPPSDIRQVRLIHKTVEAVIDHGPSFEALLMSRPEVQKDEKWAWIWDARSTGGVWYRWRLWEVIAGPNLSASFKKRTFRTAPSLHQLFVGTSPWADPQDVFPFEFTTDFGEVVSDTDYDSSDEEESDDEGDARNRRRQQLDPSQREDNNYMTDDPNEEAHLNPLQRAKLIHLLSRLPSTTGKLRRGDVARITSFAISHASCGAAEVVEILVSNVKRPLSFSQNAKGSDRIDREDSEMSNDEAMEEDDPTTQTQGDSSAATQIALHLISDILSASSTSGVRHAWRFRTLFENALTRHNVFLWLGNLDKTLNWGRLRAEKWKRSIMIALDQWDSWSIFPEAAQARFVEEFEKGNKEDQTVEDARAKKGFKSKGTGWRKVGEERSTPADDGGSDDAIEAKGKTVGETMKGDGMNESMGAVKLVSAQDTVPDVDNMVLDEVTPANPSAYVATDGGSGKVEASVLEKTETKARTVTPRKPRPKAVDMFAASDDEDE